MLINSIRHTKSDSDLFFYSRNILNGCLKPVFEHKISFWIYVLVPWNNKGYYVVKKLVWNVRIKLSGIKKTINLFNFSFYFLFYYLIMYFSLYLFSFSCTHKVSFNLMVAQCSGSKRDEIIVYMRILKP